MMRLFYARDIGTKCVRGQASKLHKRNSSLHDGTRPHSRSSCPTVRTQIWQGNVLANQRLRDLKQTFPTRNNATPYESLVHLGPVPSLCCEALGRASVEHHTAYEAKVAKVSRSDLGSETFITGRQHPIHAYRSMIILKVGNHNATGAILLHQVVKPSKRVLIAQSVVVAEQKAIASIG